MIGAGDGSETQPRKRQRLDLTAISAGRAASLGATFNFAHPCHRCKKNKKGVAYCRGMMGHTGPEYAASQEQAAKDWDKQTI